MQNHGIYQKSSMVLFDAIHIPRSESPSQDRSSVYNGSTYQRHRGILIDNTMNLFGIMFLVDTRNTPMIYIAKVYTWYIPGKYQNSIQWGFQTQVSEFPCVRNAMSAATTRLKQVNQVCRRRSASAAQTTALREPT